MARKGHGWPKGCRWRGALCIPAGYKEMTMPDHSGLDRALEIIAVTELSLILVGFMYYYLVQLPEQQRGLCVTEQERKAR